MQEGKWYFDESDRTVSTMQEGIELEVCVVSCFDKCGVYKYEFGEKSKAHAALLASAQVLLQALEGLMELEPRGRIMPIGKEWDKARAAIAAARGTV